MVIEKINFVCAVVILFLLVVVVYVYLGNSVRLKKPSEAYDVYVKKSGGKFKDNFVYRRIPNKEAGPNEYLLETYSVDASTQRLEKKLEPMVKHQHGNDIRLLDNERGFRISDITEPFECADNWIWVPDEKRCKPNKSCIKKPIGIKLPLYNDEGIVHKRKYAVCENEHSREPTIHNCKPNEMFNGTECYEYDICKDNFNGTKHTFTNVDVDRELNKNEYYECYNGISFLNKCPENHYFDAKRSNCIMEELSTCTGKKNGETIYDPSDMHSFVTCINEMPQTSLCSHGVYNDETNNITRCRDPLCFDKIHYFETDYVKVPITLQYCYENKIYRIESDYKLERIEKKIRNVNIFPLDLYRPDRYLDIGTDDGSPNRATIKILDMKTLGEKFTKQTTIMARESIEFPERLYNITNGTPAENTKYHAIDKMIYADNKPFAAVTDYLPFYDSDIIYKITAPFVMIDRHIINILDDNIDWQSFDIINAVDDGTTHIELTVTASDGTKITFSVPNHYRSNNFTIDRSIPNKSIVKPTYQNLYINHYMQQSKLFNSFSDPSNTAAATPQQQQQQQQYHKGYLMSNLLFDRKFIIDPPIIPYWATIFTFSDYRKFQSDITLKTPQTAKSIDELLFKSDWSTFIQKTT